MTGIDERDRWRGWLEDDEGRGTLLWKTSDDLFFGRSTLPSSAGCPAPLNKELGSAAPSDRLQVS